MRNCELSHHSMTETGSQTPSKGAGMKNLKGAAAFRKLCCIYCEHTHTHTHKYILHSTEDLHFTGT